MTLGNRIAALRADLGLSQGDLAEKMGVSRQSVSKWETDASVPDIDNLIFLSDLFGVTLDALVKGEGSFVTLADRASGNNEDAAPGGDATQASSATCTPSDDKGSGSATAPEPKPPISMTQKILGFIFLGVGLFTVVLGLSLGFGLIIFAPLLIVYGIVCLTVRKHAGLICCWATVLPCVCLMPYFTSCSINALFSALYWMELEAYSVQLIVSAVFWVLILTLSFFTAKATPARNHPFIATGWVALFLLRGHIGYGILTPINFYGLGLNSSLHHITSDPLVRANAVVQFVCGMGANFLLVLLIYLTYRAIRAPKDKH